MRAWWRLTTIGLLTAATMLALGSSPSMASPRAHVYLLRGLLNIFSLGMDTLAEELNKRGVYSTVDNHADWQSLADQAAANYRAGKEGPIILIGHSLGADAVMEMAAYLGRRGVPVALVVPFDGTQSYAASANVERVLNLTLHYYMGRGAGFHGSLINVDLSANPNIDHLNIDKSPRLHARVIAEVMAIVGGRRLEAPRTAAKAKTVGANRADEVKMPSVADSAAKDEAAPPATVPAKIGEKIGDKTVAKAGDGAVSSTGALKPLADRGTPIIALPEPSPGATAQPGSAPAQN